MWYRTAHWSRCLAPQLLETPRVLCRNRRIESAMQRASGTGCSHRRIVRRSRRWSLRSCHQHCVTITTQTPCPPKNTCKVCLRVHLAEKRTEEVVLSRKVGRAVPRKGPRLHGSQRVRAIANLREDVRFLPFCGVGGHDSLPRGPCGLNGGQAWVRNSSEWIVSVNANVVQCIPKLDL